MSAPRVERLTLLTGLPALTINDRLQGTGSVEYRFRAKVGQTLRLKLLSDYADLTFDVQSPLRMPTMPEPAPMLNEWERELAADGEYAVRVALPRHAASRGDIATYALTFLLLDPNDGTLLALPRVKSPPLAAAATTPRTDAATPATSTGVGLTEPPPITPTVSAAVPPSSAPIAPLAAPSTAATATPPVAAPVPSPVASVSPSPSSRTAAPAKAATSAVESRAAAADTWEVTGIQRSEGLRVRAGPSTRHAVIGMLDRHARGLRNLGCTGHKGQRWCKVSRTGAAPLTGWVSADYLRKSER